MNPSGAVAAVETSTGALAVTGSKGGVGKSNLVLNLAVALGRWGRRVLLVDGDLGLANLDVLMGLVPERTAEHLIRGDASLDDVLVDGPEGVRVLPAASGVPTMARLDESSRRRLLGTLAEGAGQVDDVLVDTGAGLGDATLALQLAASRVIVVTTPEPTSLVDAYASLKVLWSADPEKPVDLVVNAAGDDEEAGQAYEQIARAARHFLGRAPGWLGPVYRDPKVPVAVRRQRALLELFPQCPAARCYERIATRLVSAPAVLGQAADYWRRLMVPAQEELPH
jgi:flagellar biosynthesis protein FlhG